jgi:DNA-binding transcriptional LysR family regulator
MTMEQPRIRQIGSRFKLRDLRILLTVAEVGTMGKAAQALAVSQPVVSKAISDLEYAVGARLLDRSQHGVAPTAHGRALIKRGIAIFDEMRQGLKDLEKLSDPAAGEVSIGATASAATAIVSPVIDGLSRQYPRMRFRVLVADSAPLFGALESRAIELAISRPPRPSSDDYGVEVLFHDTLAVITGAGNPLARRRRRWGLAELKNEPWLLSPADSHFGSLQAEVFRASGLEPPLAAVEVASSHLRNELLATQRFLTIVPGFSILLPHRRSDVRALKLSRPVPPEPVALITLKGRSLGPAAQLFIDSTHELTKPLAKTTRRQ